MSDIPGFIVAPDFSLSCLLMLAHLEETTLADVAICRNRLQPEDRGRERIKGKKSKNTNGRVTEIRKK